MRFARFVAVGAANTAASYAVYLLLLLVVDYRIAYTIAFAAGLAGGYLGHARLVFGARPAALSLLAYAGTYALMYGASLAVLYLVVGRWSWPRPLGMLGALMVTVPTSYALLRRGFRTRA